MDQPVLLVLVGVTGDLAKRKLLKAIANIGKKGLWPGKNAQFKMLGVTRQEGISVEKLVESFADDTEAVDFLKNHLEIFPMDLSNPEAYEKLSKKLEDVEKNLGASDVAGKPPAERLFYLSVPAQASEQVIEMLGTSGLSKVPNTKLMLEKPFGSDYDSAETLIKNIKKHFTPEQVYRVDHFLAKSIAEKIINAKNSDSELNKVIDDDVAKKITVLASEKIGVEGRGNFYEQTGALRDLVQSHLLQLAALTIMEPQYTSSASSSQVSLPARRLAALKTLSIPTDKPISEYVTRGQYKGYREEVKNNESMTETYVSLTLNSSDSHLSGIPIMLTTGKNMAEKKTQVCVETHNNTPQHEVVFEEDDAYDAYEKVFLNAMKGDTQLFVTDEEVLECWRIIRPVLAFWNENNTKNVSDLKMYEPGWQG